MKLKLFALASKYGVEIIQSVPGHVIVRIATWHRHEHKIVDLINELKNDENIYSITWERGVVEIQYNPNVVNDRSAINYWFHLLDKYGF